jgi:hypothetical protein
LQIFTKLRTGKCTTFGPKVVHFLYLAVVMDFVLLAEIKIQSIAGIHPLFSSTLKQLKKV